MKNLPIGIQSFKDLREKNYLYIDKTGDIHRLITTGKIYFL
ncbi:MAG: AAA family ATPase, partial [Tannerella sp.]|nr:AAA family ATPase [Tannerella sp.]